MPDVGARWHVSRQDAGLSGGAMQGGGGQCGAQPGVQGSHVSHQASSSPAPLQFPSLSHFKQQGNFQAMHLLVSSGE